MPRPVCFQCKREMRWDRAGTVQFDALAVGGPYQQFQADIAKCPSCGWEVAARYGDGPTWQSFEPEADRDQKPEVIAMEVRGG